MKIAILTSAGVDRSGTRHVVPCLLWLIERLARGGDEVHVFCLCQEPQPGTWKLRGATVHNAGRKPRPLRMLAQIVAEHRKSPFHVFHATWSLLAYLVAGTAGRLLRVPVLLYFGNQELINLPDIKSGLLASRRGRTLLRIAVAGADCIVAQSAPMVEKAHQLGIAARRIPMGVALDRWPPGMPRRRLAGAPARLLHVANIVPVKDHDMLLDMAVELQSKIGAFEIDVIGEDVAGDGAVQRRAKQLGLEERVHFHGALPHHEVRPYYDRADILVVTSRHEAGPLVALEAAIAGVPTAGTAVGHLAEWAPLAARIVAPRDSAGLAAAIADLLSNEEGRLALAFRAQEKALAENADITSRRFRDTYAELQARAACRGSTMPAAMPRADGTET